MQLSPSSYFVLSPNIPLLSTILKHCESMFSLRLRETKLHTHTKQQATVYLYVYMGVRKSE
jgi:hypothetical protein